MKESKNTDVIYRVARTKEELIQAFSLVYKEYTKRGFIPNYYKSKMRLSLYNALPSTTTFVAKKGRKVVATVTLIPDSPLGIPMDKIYKEEVDTLRRKGRRVAEVSQLSIDSMLFPRGWFSMFNFTKLIFVFRLFKLVLDYSLYIDRLDELCIAVNPKHQYLYKFLYFEELAGGEVKYYGSVNKAPAIAKHLSLNLAETKARQRKGLYNIFFGQPTDQRLFKNKFKFSLSDLDYFFVQKSDIFEKAAPAQIKYIKSCYPGMELGKLF